jgi:hypothetical protein
MIGRFTAGCFIGPWDIRGLVTNGISADDINKQELLQIPIISK